MYIYYFHESDKDVVLIFIFISVNAKAKNKVNSFLVVDSIVAFPGSTILTFFHNGI
jgi:hypothetical protein